MDRKRLSRQISEYLNKNKSATCDDMQKFADKLGIDIKEVRCEVLNMAKLFSIFWLGGRGPEKGIKISNVDPKELKMGIKVELEHCPNKVIATKIALDHLAEEGLERYYTNLINMEKAIKEKRKTIELIF